MPVLWTPGNHSAPNSNRSYSCKHAGLKLWNVGHRKGTWALIIEQHFNGHLKCPLYSCSKGFIVVHLLEIWIRIYEAVTSLHQQQLHLYNIVCSYGTACDVFAPYHQQSLVGIDNAQPNGHVGVLTVFQERTDGDVSSLGVRLLTTTQIKERKKEEKN